MQQPECHRCHCRDQKNPDSVHTGSESGIHAEGIADKAHFREPARGQRQQQRVVADADPWCGQFGQDDGGGAVRARGDARGDDVI